MEVDMLKAGAAFSSVDIDYQSSKRMKTESNNSHKDSNEKLQSAVAATQIDKSSDLKRTNMKSDLDNEDSTKQDTNAETNEVIDKALEDANKKLSPYNKEFKYSVHEATNKVVVKIIDSNTKEVVKEIPPEKTLDAVAKMWELAGILFDEKR